MTSQPTNQNPEPRRQTPEETLNRIAGVPKTLEEQQAEAAQLDQERTATAQRNAGIQPNQPGQPTNVEQEQERQRQMAQERDESKRRSDQREKADH